MPGRPNMAVLNLQSLAASSLADSEGLSVASKMLESCLAGPDIPLDLIVQDLCSVPNLFEFIVSTFSSAQGLVHKILNTFPPNPTLVEASSASVLLRRLSSVLFALPPDLFDTDTFRLIGRHQVYVEDGLRALTLLYSAEFLSHITADLNATNPSEDPEYDCKGHIRFRVRNKKQQKSGRKQKNTTSVDLAPLQKLGAKIPSDNVEASRMADEVSHELKMILKFYLELLLEPFVAQHLKQAYVSRNDDAIVRPSEPQEAKPEVIDAVESKSSAYPKVQPMKAALYFENAEGFGEWRIIIGTDAIRKLREFANGDRKKCAIVVKKIKQLSNGHFSDENQKRLNGSSGIPIFEAKMQRDLRLVYQVDVVPDHNGEVEQQAIKIYGIYTHTQLNRIWDAVGQHLAGKGKEYRRRCIFRTPLEAGGDVYLPASFPPENITKATGLIPLVLSDEEVMGELHSLLVLEKYVAFSQGFLHSLIANQDVQHVFELTPQERRIVECTTSCYVLGRSGTGKTTTMLFKMLGMQRAWEMQMSHLPKPRQVFVTKSHVLATKVQEYFMKLLESLVLVGYSREDLKRIQARNSKLGLVDADDVEQRDLPQKYSALEESHFPLFVTFDKLSRMIAADLASDDEPESQRFARIFVDTDEILEAKDSFVTYDVFARTYWPHFPQSLTKGLEPWLVFSEIIGIIKGSEKSLSCPDGFLDMEAYCSLPARSNPTFANQRGTLYAIFEAYCKHKKERRHHDVADRTQAILKTFLKGIPLKGQKVNYLYIDEAQDNLMIDALLLRLICRNPEGLFWAGDTAQTISAGSSFRFDDLKAFLYRIEQNQSMHLIQDRSVADPTSFQLTINYRSHGGIVNCAHTVIERIMQFWPDAIDNLKPERGIVDGLKPVFFRGWGEDIVQCEQFLFGESGSPIEFGAQQCILVRDDEAVDKLYKKLGKNSKGTPVIISLYKSKGLEFNDVLLYNFFEDSPVDVSRWRVLLNDAEGEVDGQDLATIRAPSFGRDEGRFAGVCSELKMLYVGITRARKNLWIFDKSDKSEPMRMIWTSRHQVQNCTPGMDVPHLAISSTPEEWESFGHDLFVHRRYREAKHCFARALQPRMVAICEAFHLREEARAKVDIASRKVQQDAFFIAADAFVACAKKAPPSKDKLQYYCNAAECYARGGDNRKAATTYLDAEEYDLAARRYRKSGLFDKTLEVLHSHAGKISSESSRELLTVCRLYYCSNLDVIRPPLPLFSSSEEELEFLENYELDFARATLLENLGRYEEAAGLHLAGDRPLDAVKDLLKKSSRHAIQRASRIVLDSLWRRCSFGITHKKVAADQQVNDFLNLADEFPVDFLDPLDHREIFMFRAIAQADFAVLEKLSREFDAKRKAAALLALDHFFSRLPDIKSYSLTEMSQFLDKFRKYALLLCEIISHPNPLRTTSIKRLLCISEISNAEYSMELGSFLHCSATADHQGPMRFQPSVVTLSRGEMVTALRKCLAAHLCERVTKENKLCCRATAFSLCLTFIVNGECDRVKCPQGHVKPADLDSRRYTSRIGIHLQQICILQLMHSVNPQLNPHDCVLDWLSHLYEAFNPQSYVQGSIADLNLSLIPGAHERIAIMKSCVRKAIYNSRVHHNLSGLTNVLRLTNLIFAFDESSAVGCIEWAILHDAHARVPEFVYPDGRYVFEDVVCLFDGTQENCISSGLLFLRHVLKPSLSLDLSIFCDLLEKVVGKISIAWRLSPQRQLDGLVLPRSWLTSIKDFSGTKEIDIDLIVDFLDCMRDLLVILKSGDTNRKYSLSHTKLTQTLCNVFTARICRALCLLTHNVEDTDIRNKVKSVLDALQTGGHTHKFYQKYIEAGDGEGLKAVIDYDVDAKVVIQDLVQLHEERDPQDVSLLGLPRIEHVTFADPLDIPSLLVPRLVARPKTRPCMPASVPRILRASQVEKIDEEERNLPVVPKVEPVGKVHEEPQGNTLEPVKSREHEPTAEEISAATKIQAAYRTYRKHRDAQAGEIGRATHIVNRALPRLLACLDKAISVAYVFKNKTKGQFSKGDHECLEEVGKQMNMIHALVKDGHSLRKRIKLNAAIYQADDKNAMKKAVSDVKDFIHRLPGPTLSQEIRDEFQVAYELIIVEKQPVSGQEKPTLKPDL